MPVHEIRYRPWEGTLQPQWIRLLAIPRFSLMSAWNKWATMALFSSFIQVMAIIAYLLLITNPLIQEFIQMPAHNLPQFPAWRLMSNMFLLQFFIGITLGISVAPRLISSERAHKALPLIYSRPVTRLGYILGKVSAVAFPLSLITWVQAGVLFIAMMLIYPAENAFWMNFWGESLPMGVGAIVLGMVMTLTLSTFFLACSAATTNHVFAGILPLLILFGVGFLTQVMQEGVMAGFPDLGLRELHQALAELLLFPVASSTLSPVNTVVVMLLWIGVSVGFMMWRLRPVDVYTE